jgi:two-component system chemotaxis response regulator CheB
MPTKVFIVDDSPLMQKVLADTFSSDPTLSVVGFAKDGEEALEKIPRIKPDVVTLDIEMPKMNGLTTLRRIMASNPLPVVMVSAHSQEGAQLTLAALEFGAIDYIPKPAGQPGAIESIRQELISKIKAAATAKIIVPEATTAITTSRITKTDKIIALGASTGGPQALTQVLTQLPWNIPPTLIVQHMPPAFTKVFANSLSTKCKFRVKEAEEGDILREGLALLAPGDYHMTITRAGRVKLNQGPQINFVRPAVDPMMQTLADAYGQRVIGVILTGMGSDGAIGLKQIKTKGGKTIAQDERTSTVYGMPKAAAALGAADQILPLRKVSDAIIKLCQE